MCGPLGTRLRSLFLMSHEPTERTPHHDRQGWTRLVFGLLVAPCTVVLAAWAFPKLRVGALLADVIAFAGAAGVAILGLAVSATAEVALAGTLGIAAVAGAALLTLTFWQPSPSFALAIVNGALVSLAWALGTSLGRRVQHPAHLFPACVVAASADLVSLLSPEGPSHAIANSERALSVLAVGFPVPGSAAVAPALGVGDLLFMTLALGVARAHGLPYARTVGCCVLGVALAGLAAACLGVAIPALLPIAGALLVGLPMIRRLRREDRAAAKWSMVIAGSVALASVARGLCMK